MAKAKQMHSTIITEGKFNNITPPDFELFNILLKERDYQITDVKTQSLVSSDKTFEITIDASKVSKSYIQLLSNELKVAFSLSFAPFNLETKSYNFYINRYAGDMDNRDKILNGIFDTLKDFEIDYFKKLENAKPVFEKAKEDLKNFQTEEFDVRFSNKLDTFVVVAKAYMGPSIYKNIANCSKRIGKCLENSEIIELFDNNPKYNKKSYFIINQNDYIAINDYIRSLKSDNENFLIVQDKFYNDSEEARFNELIFDMPNIFEYKVKINKDRKCFEFFCNGFEKSSPWEGITPQRNLLQTWALNFILSSPLSKMNSDEYKIDSDIELLEVGQELVSYQKDSSKKEKIYYVPFTEIEKLERIQKNFIKESNLWSREQFTVKHSCANYQKIMLNANLKKYPAVYLASDGQAYLIFDSKESPSRKINIPIINLKGIKITPDEFKEFITTHPFSENIENNTKFLNAQLWGGPTAVFNYESINSAYNDIIMAYRINNMPKENKTIKRLKI